jgi:hypothetical protein
VHARHRELEQQVLQERKEKAKLVHKIEEMQGVIEQGERETTEALAMVQHLCSQASVKAAQKLAALLQSSAIELRETRRQLEVEKKQTSQLRGEQEQLRERERERERLGTFHNGVSRASPALLSDVADIFRWNGPSPPYSPESITL